MLEREPKTDTPRTRAFIIERASFVRLPWVALVAMLAVFLAACGGGGSDGIGLQTRTIALEEVNDSGYSGEVLLTTTGDNRTVVVVSLGREEVSEGDFPAAIHEGSCTGLSGEEIYKLDSLRAGFLVKELPTSLATLEERDHYLVVFESNERSVYVACAKIP